MAKARAKTNSPVKSARSIEQELISPSTTAEVAQEFDVTEIAQEEQTELDQKKEEGLRKLKINNDLLQAQVNKLNDDNRARKTHSLLIFRMVFSWILFVMVILFGVGIGKLTLSDKVLITLLSTTSINIIGLLVIVANYLFNKSKST